MDEISALEPRNRSASYGAAWPLYLLAALNLLEYDKQACVVQHAEGCKDAAHRQAGRAAGASPAPTFVDGIWLVELAPLADPALVPQAVASALGLPEQPGRTPLAVLAAYLRSKDVLLILDNCEHLIGACAELVEALLSACSHLHILATSREALNVSGEVSWRVPSLSTPDPAHPPTPEQMLDFEAIELFIDHAAAAQPRFTLDPGNMAAIVHVCQRLDGIPLAIEMAAALSVAEIAVGLDDHFALRLTGRRTALPRHQTLRATLDWSYALLSQSERVLLARLSVFAGGWPGVHRIILRLTITTGSQGLAG